MHPTSTDSQYSPLRRAPQQAEADVLILGGGLAGLCLALQIRKRNPDSTIVVLERAAFPRPEAVAKVGESTVEIGSHYLAEHVGLRQHLEKEHLRKFGIRLFFGPPSEDFSDHDEMGVSHVFNIPTYQIDRGRLENHLWQQAEAQQISVHQQAEIIDLNLAKKDSSVAFRDSHGEEHKIKARWMVDAAGRAGLLKKQLQLASPSPHKANAVWFRVDKRIQLDDWSQSTQWHERCQPQGQRWLSTNHLMGPGYWVWVIPLATNITSIGIVMDDEAKTNNRIVDEASARDWLAQRHPHCAAAMEGARFLDFIQLDDYAYDCKQLFSADGWALTGESGRFADPLYSPGSDFIAFSNDFICNLISADFAGEDIQLTCLIYEKVLRSIYENTLSVYLNQYGGFGDRIFMGAKLLWDYAYYWGVLALLYFGNGSSDTELVKRLGPKLQVTQKLNAQVQDCFRQRAEKRIELASQSVFIDQYQVPCLKQFNVDLDQVTPKNIEQKLDENTEKLVAIARIVEDLLSDSPAREICDQERELLGEYRRLLIPELRASKAS